MASLARRFLANRETDVSRLKELVAAAAWDEARIIGHNLKGTGRAFGFADISEIGAALEQAALGRDGARITDLAGDLASYLRDVRLTSR